MFSGSPEPNDRSVLDEPIDRQCARQAPGPSGGPLQCRGRMRRGRQRYTDPVASAFSDPIASAITGLPIEQISKPIVPMVAVLIGVLILVTYVPSIILSLPLLVWGPAGI